MYVRNTSCVTKPAFLACAIQHMRLAAIKVMTSASPKMEASSGHNLVTIPGYLRREEAAGAG